MFNIGDKVEFMYIVGRKRDTSSQGITHTPYHMLAPGAGTVIGKTRVYRSEVGWDWEATPVLTNPQTVYLVAVSDWKRVKVFEEDMTLITPQNLPPAQHRKATDPADLDKWVVDALNVYVGNKTEFTAYDVTKLVRGDHPDYDISHDDVRGLVFAYMQPVMASGLYKTEARNNGSYTAITFIAQ